MNLGFDIAADVTLHSGQTTLRAGLVAATRGMALCFGPTNPTFATRTGHNVIVARIVRRAGPELCATPCVDPADSSPMKLVFRADALDVNAHTALLEARRLYDEALRLDGGFNPSTQQLHEIVVLAFRSAASFSVVR